MDEVNQSLQKIAKGTGIVFIGTIVGLLFGFVSRVLVARFFSQSEYGIFSLAFVILNIVVIVSTLGFKEGTTRQIAYYRGRNEFSNVQGVVFSSLKLPLISSLILTVLVFFSSDFISAEIFHETGLAPALRIISIAIPFLVLIQVLISIFRGFDEVKPKIYFENILKSSLFPVFLAPVIILNLSFQKAMYAFLASFVVSCVLFLFYTIRKAPFFMKGSVKKVTQNKTNIIEKELILFSLPLFATAVLNMIMSWTDTLMLGYFKTADIVGLYNGALPLAQLIPIGLASMVFIYTPIVSQLFPKNLLLEIKRSYVILTKWIFSVTFPIFLVFFLFPDFVLSFLFGLQYVDAALSLRLLALGFFIHTFLGPNGATLISMGETRIIMWASFFSAGLNIVLNASLIPIIGLNGAAIATASSLVLANIILSTRLYFLSRVHPFTRNYLKPIISSFFPILVIYYFSITSFGLSFLNLFILFFLFIFIYGLSLLATKSFEKEDIDMLITIEKRLGIDAKFLKKVLRRFI